MTWFDNDVSFTSAPLNNQVFLPLTLMFFLLNNKLKNSRLLAEMYLIQVKNHISVSLHEAVNCEYTETSAFKKAVDR